MQPNDQPNPAPAPNPAPTTPQPTPVMTPNGQPYVPAPGAPMPNMPTPKPPKQPMDPAKKKRIIIICSVVVGLLVIGIALAIILPIVLRVDYSEAYRVAGKLEDEIDNLYQDYDCSNVESYVDSSYITDKDYASYVEKCKNSNSGITPLINELEQTAGVQKNADIKARFETFKSTYNSLAVSPETKETALETYTVWHKWKVAKDDLDSWDETDADLTSAANILINSNNEKFKTYGEGWLTHRKAAAQAYRAYWAASYSDSNKSNLRNEMNSAQTTYNNYVKEHQPSVNDFPPVAIEDASKIVSEFDKLYTLIRDTYEKNYNSGSGDCLEVLGEVICD